MDPSHTKISWLDMNQIREDHQAIAHIIRMEAFTIDIEAFISKATGHINVYSDIGFDIMEDLYLVDSLHMAIGHQHQMAIASIHCCLDIAIGLHHHIDASHTLHKVAELHDSISPYKVVILLSSTDLHKSANPLDFTNFHMAANHHFITLDSTHLKAFATNSIARVRLATFSPRLGHAPPSDAYKHPIGYSMVHYKRSTARFFQDTSYFAVVDQNFWLDPKLLNPLDSMANHNNGKVLVHLNLWVARKLPMLDCSLRNICEGHPLFLMRLQPFWYLNLVYLRFIDT